MNHLTLTTNSDERKHIPLGAGLWGYFPAALVGVAKHSYKSNEKHNKGQPLHWSIDKSTDHAETIQRHWLDLQELIAYVEAADWNTRESGDNDALLDEANALAWRALALSQVLHMKYARAPLPFNARRTEPEAGTMQLEGYPSPRCSNCKQQSCSCEIKRA